MREMFESLHDLKKENLEFVLEIVEAGSPVLILATKEGCLVVKRNASKDDHLIKTFAREKFLYTGVGKDGDYYELFEVTKKIYRDLVQEFSPTLEEVYDVHTNQIAQHLRKYMSYILDGNVWMRPKNTPYTVDVVIGEADFFGKPLLYSVHYNREMSQDLIFEEIKDDLYTLPYSFRNQVEETVPYAKTTRNDAIAYVSELKKKGLFDKESSRYALEAMAIEDKEFKPVLIV